MRRREIIGTIFCFCLFSISCGWGQGRIESEYKLAVPKEIEHEVWTFLVKNYGPSAIQRIDSNFTSLVAEEIFFDQYFDDVELNLYQQQGGARYRKRFIADTLSKALFQLKLPLDDSIGIARKEIKFDLYHSPKKSDRAAMHPFWKYIQPQDRNQVDLALFPLGTEGKRLLPTVKVKQNRKRIYISENAHPLLTMTFDRVSNFSFPFLSFIELELELNEIRYTEANETERQRLEHINRQLKQELAMAFPQLVQDQTPKYNKMSDLLEASPWSKIYNNLAYLIFAIIVLFAIVLFIKDGKKTTSKAV